MASFVDLERFGDQLALVDRDGTAIAYDELSRRVDRLRARLGDDRRLVLLEIDHTVDAVVAYLAALAGRHPVAVVSASNRDTARSLLDRFDPDVVIAAENGWHPVERRVGTAHDLHPDLALAMSTSGTTGSPKLVRLAATSVHANAAAIVDALGITATDRAITTLPLGYCYGLSVLNSHLLAGAGVVLNDASVVDGAFWDRVRTHGVTQLNGVPHTCSLLDSIGFRDMHVPSLRVVTQAGGRLEPDRVRAFAAAGRRHGWQFVVMYGQTEATARMAYLPPELAERHPAAIGRPIAGGSFTIADDGELIYRGPNVMLGYAEAPADLALGRTVTALHTGDLARRTDDGLYELCGRAARFIKPFGLRVDLDATERRLRADGIEALCTGDDRRLVVAVATSRTDLGTERARVLRATSAMGLPAHAVSVLDVATLPRRDNGKPDYPAVRRAAEAQAAPHATDDDPVRAVFCEVLGVRTVDDADTFVDLGGDSLSYVELCTRLTPLVGHLPPDWHTRRIGSLRAAAPTSGPPPLDTTVVLRALAIVAVVATHARLAPLFGGAHLLLAVAGYNAARFTIGPSTTGHLRRGLTQVARIAVPTIAFLAAMTLVVEGIHLSTVVLASTYGGEGTWRYRFWFIEVLVQLLAILIVVWSVPAVRRLERRAPFVLAMGVVAIGLVARTYEFAGDEFDVIRTHAVIWIFALGWAAERADTSRRRVLVSVVAVAATVGAFDDPQRTAAVLVGVAALVWLPHLRLPARLHRPLGALAGASLLIYLTHWQIVIPLRDIVGGWVAGALALAAAFAAQATWRRVRRSALVRIDPPTLRADAREPLRALTLRGVR